MKGDINRDGQITVEDVATLKRILANASEEEIVAKIDDVNGDGVVNIKDIAALKKLIKSLSE